MGKEVERRGRRGGTLKQTERMEYEWGKQMDNQVHPFEPAFTLAGETF